MKIAITGGAGFIGSHITKAYLDAGHDVVVIDSLLHGRREALDPRARFYHIDIRDGKLRTILQQERPDLLSHHAARHEQRQDGLPGEQSLADADVHIRGLLNVLDSCASASVRKVIFASGGNTLYGCIDAEHLPITEDTPLCPQHPYDISKVAGEWYLRYYTQHYGLKHTILRYADVYGETRNTPVHHPLSYFISTLLEQHHPIIRGADDEMRDNIFIDDVVQANLCALKRGDNQTVHISSGHGCTLNQLYRLVTLLLSSQAEPVYLSGSWGESFSIVLDNTRAQRVLGWHPEVSLTEGIRRAMTLLRGPEKQFVPAKAEKLEDMAVAMTGTVALVKV